MRHRVGRSWSREGAAMSASAMWWISVLVFLFWCYSWVLAYRVKKLLFWAFWNTVMGFVLCMSLFALAAGSPWLPFLSYCSLLAIPRYWMMPVRRGGP